MNLETYERRARGKHASLAETVANVLTAAIPTHPDLRLQHVQHRAKDPVSLRSKLEKAGATGSGNIEGVVKDLAGCRLVFYTNSDVSKFLSSGIVRDNFDIDWERTKIHHPSPDSKAAADLFISINYVARLNEQRVALPEYAHLRGMWCEVQVQTTLNHAWAEMAHDTIYKKLTLKGFGGSLMQGIEKRMEKIMRDFLLPAGYEFQKVVNDFERLSSGKELFDRGALQALSDCDDNNMRHDLLQRFATYVLPHYDDLQSVQSKVRSAVVGAVERARLTSTRSIDTPFGALSGHSIEEIVDVGADILDRIRYLGPEAVNATFDAICRLFPSATTDAERKRLLQSARDLSKHELDVWKATGPLVQQLLVERIRHLDAAVLALLKPVAMEVLDQVLQPEVEGTLSTYDTITIHTGSVQPGEMLSCVRSNAIEVLKNLFRDAKTDSERRAIVQVLSTATRTPYIGNYPNALLKIVLENTTRIVDFYNEVAGDQSHEILQQLEHDLLWLYRRNRDMPDEIAADAEIATARERLTESIFAFRDLVNQNRAFCVYKTLVGYQSVFTPAWEDGDFEIEGQDAYRTQRMRELVNEVTEAHAEEWLAVLSRCAQTESFDLATFPTFGQFLEELGRSKPQILITYLDRLSDRLANFLPSMLIGLEDGDKWNAARDKVQKWVNRRQYLRQVVWYQRFTAKFDATLLEQSLTAAIEAGDDLAVHNAVSVSAERHGDVAGGLIERVFLHAVGYLTAKGDSSWVNNISPRPTKNPLFQDLKSEQMDTLLASLVRHPQIGYRVDEILASAAASSPAKVIDFFGSRLKVEQTPDCPKNYEAIPYELHKLRELLATIPDCLVERVRSWFEEDEQLFAYRGGRLLSIVFPNWSQAFERALQRLVGTHERTNLEFIVKVLHNYKRQDFTHAICKGIVEILPTDDPLLDAVDMALDSTGVVRGEFGFAEAYRRKKTEIEPWLKDSRERVQLFAKRRLLGLERKIAAEQRSSEESLEMRRRDYGEGESYGE